MTLDDALALEQMLMEKSRVFIVGAGLIGMKCAEGIAQRVARIDICDLAPRVLPSVLDDEAAALVQREMECHGCVFHLGTSVKKFEKNAAILENGERIPFDILVTAVGRPAQHGIGGPGGRGGGQRDRNRRQRTHHAGECLRRRRLRGKHRSDTGRKGVIAILPNAYLQGRAAGVSMAGGQEEFTETMPMNAGGFFDVHLVTAGSYDGESHITRGENSYRRLVIKDGLLKGFIIVGDVSRAGIYTALIPEADALGAGGFGTAAGETAADAVRPHCAGRNAGREGKMKIDAKGLSYRALDRQIRDAEDAQIQIDHCCGQRFIGAGSRDKQITIHGTPGNALGCYLNGSRIDVHGSGQDAIGDTMNDGMICIYGQRRRRLRLRHARRKDLCPGNAGYRTGIHMKEYKDKKPIIIIGNEVGSFSANTRPAAFWWRWGWKAKRRLRWAITAPWACTAEKCTSAATRCRNSLIRWRPGGRRRRIWTRSAATWRNSAAASAMGWTRSWKSPSMC